MNWQPPTASPESDPISTLPVPAPESTTDAEALEPDPVGAGTSDLIAQDPLVEAETPALAEAEVSSPDVAAPVVQVDDVVETIMAAEATPEEVVAPPRGTVHHFEATSRRPIDKFLAACFNDIGRLVGTNINAGKRGGPVTIVGTSPTGIQRATPKGDTTDVPLAALEWAIKQLYWNGELTRSKMTESYKENGSSVASGVFQILGACKYFEATELPLTLHFYRLQWEQDQDAEAS